MKKVGCKKHPQFGPMDKNPQIKKVVRWTIIKKHPQFWAIWVKAFRLTII
jgi:hypothetical protein